MKRSLFDCLKSCLLVLVRLIRELITNRGFKLHFGKTVQINTQSKRRASMLCPCAIPKATATKYMNADDIAL